MYTSAGTSNRVYKHSWIVTQGHNQAQPHVCLRWLRVAAWAKDPHISALNHSAKLTDLFVVKWPCCSATEPDWFPKLCKPSTSENGQAISYKSRYIILQNLFWQTVRQFCHLFLLLFFCWAYWNKLISIILKECATCLSHTQAQFSLHFQSC